MLGMIWDAIHAEPPEWSDNYVNREPHGHINLGSTFVFLTPGAPANTAVIARSHALPTFFGRPQGDTFPLLEDGQVASSQRV